MPLWIQSQTIHLTPAQETRVKQIFTPSKIKDISKGIQNERRQQLVIQSLQSKIDSLKFLASAKDIIITNYGNEILLLNNKIRNINNEENEVADNQLKDARKPFLGLHLKVRAALIEFEPSTINYYSSLSYDLKKFSVGIMLWTNSTTELPQRNVFYGPFIAYNIF